MSVVNITRRSFGARLIGALLTLGFWGVASSEESIEREIVVEVTTPDTGWRIHIDDVTQRSDGLFVVASLRRKPGVAGSALTTVKDAVVVHAPSKLPVRIFILGKTWGWRNKEAVMFLKDRAMLDAKLAGGKQLYKAADLEGGPSEQVIFYDCVILLKPDEKAVPAHERGKRILGQAGGTFKGVLLGIEGFRAQLSGEQVKEMRKHKEVLAVDALPQG